MTGPDGAENPCKPSRRPGEAGARGTLVVTVAASTGGPGALEALFAGLTGGLPLAVLIVQHMPPGFTGGLAERLGRLFPAWQVREASDGEVVRPGRAWIAPAGQHLELAAGGRLRLSDAPPLRGLRPAADLLMASAARVAGRRAVAVVLTGMGQDGLAGARAVRAAGGHVIAQDPAEALMDSMPRAVVAAGLAHAALSLPEIGPYLARLARGP